MLGTIAHEFGSNAIFKGGTSLSKGWNLIHRFSEDIDLYIHLPSLGTKAIGTSFKRIRDSIAVHNPLKFLREKSSTIGGLGRNDRFKYDQHFSGIGEVADSVLLETGIASGREPTESVELNFLIAQFLKETKTTLNTSNEHAFSMVLLHYRRTFVEKLFAIHKKVEILKEQGIPVGLHARHYYDLYQLANKNEVLSMLQSKEYETIKVDYEKISMKYFPKRYYFTAEISFARSDALFPNSELSDMLNAKYTRQCRSLCYRDFPPWEEVLERFMSLCEVL